MEIRSCSERKVFQRSLGSRIVSVCSRFVELGADSLNSYGRKGQAIIESALRLMYSRGIIPQLKQAAIVAPFEPEEYIINVLAPETAICLMVEDMALSREEYTPADRRREAYTMLFDSREYGEAQHDDAQCVIPVSLTDAILGDIAPWTETSHCEGNIGCEIHESDTDDMLDDMREGARAATYGTPGSYTPHLDYEEQDNIPMIHGLALPHGVHQPNPVPSVSRVERALVRSPKGDRGIRRLPKAMAPELRRETGTAERILREDAQLKRLEANAAKSVVDAANKKAERLNKLQEAERKQREKAEARVRKVAEAEERARNAELAQEQKKREDERKAREKVERVKQKALNAEKKKRDAEDKAWEKARKKELDAKKKERRKDLALIEKGRKAAEQAMERSERAAAAAQSAVSTRPKPRRKTQRASGDGNDEDPTRNGCETVAPPSLSSSALYLLPPALPLETCTASTSTRTSSGVRTDLPGLTMTSNPATRRVLRSAGKSLIFEERYCQTHITHHT